MYRVLAVIPARGGSKRVPRKNIRMCSGRPLIAWTIEQAQQCKSIDRFVVSSDDDEILRIAAEFGAATIKRPERLAGDEVSSTMAVLHALEEYPAEFVVLLQPTSPLRSVADIDNAIYVARRHNAPCVSVTPAGVKPETLCMIDEQGSLRKIMKDCPPAYKLNGAVYVSPASMIGMEWFTAATRAHVMPAERSLDIDTEDDLKAAHEALHRKLYEMAM